MSKESRFGIFGKKLEHAANKIATKGAKENRNKLHKSLCRFRCKKTGFKESFKRLLLLTHSASHLMLWCQPPQWQHPNTWHR